MSNNFAPRVTHFMHKDVPLKDEDGNVIGVATVTPNGGILAVINESEHGKALYEKLTHNLLDHLSIGLDE